MFLNYLLNKSIIVISISLVGFLSCSKKNDPAPVSTSALTYTINGTTYTNTNQIIVSAQFFDQTTISLNSISIPATGGYASSIVTTTIAGIPYYELIIAGINIPTAKDSVGIEFGTGGFSSITNGTYNIGTLSFANGFYFDSKTTGNGLDANSGTLIISNIDNGNHKISGTFNFVVQNGSTTINVTNGSFTNLPFQQLSK